MIRPIFFYAFLFFIFITSGCRSGFQKRAAGYIREECDCFNSVPISLSDNSKKFLEQEIEGFQAGLRLSHYFTDLSDGLKEELKQFTVTILDTTTKLGACLHRANLKDMYEAPGVPWGQHSGNTYEREVASAAHAKKDECRFMYYYERGLIHSLYEEITGAAWK